MALFLTGDTPLPVGTNPYSTAVADLDGDGHLDLATVNAGSNDLYVRFGDGHGNFSAMPVIIPVGTTPRDIATGDVDHDGDVDLLIANGGANNVSVLLNNGAGGFTAAPTVPTGLNDRSIAVGDLNGDGRLDFVTANASVNTLSVMLGNGAGGFMNAPGSPIPSGGSVPFTVVLADLDGDGDLDMAFTNAGSNTVQIEINNGDATFTVASGSPITVGSIPRGIMAGDFDGDGDDDLAVINSSNNNISIISNGFATIVPLVATGGSVPFDGIVADLDHDGDIDIAVANASSNTLAVLVNDGSGNFTQASGSPFATGGNSPRAVAVGDFNEDGMPDLVVDNTNSSNVGILFNNRALYRVTSHSAVEGTGSHAGGDFVFTISRGATSEAETVSYTLGGTATAGIDYVVPSGLASFAIGQSTVQIHLSVRRDALAERDETVVMKLGIVNASGLIDPAHALATGVIIDDEPRTINGTNHADVLNGRPFVDTINGLGGNDVIHGGSSNDRLVGGRGADVLRGDQGSDRFVFKSILDSAGAGRDTILDFRHGQDKIDLSAIDADVSQPGNQAFHWLGETGFTLSPGQLIEKLFNRPGTASDRTVVSADVNGDGHADMQIALVGLKHLVASDFVL